MLREFESNISKNGLFNKKQPLLLAISGGIDSVVLAHLLKETGFNFSLAHCNFQLRGKESAADEKFCRHLAKTLGVKIYTKVFNTGAYVTRHKTNIQLAARKLRYDWFEALIKEKKGECILTAHHANDVIETVLINLLRGTGIKGLKGIPVTQGKVVRPLLIFTRAQIEAYAKKNGLAFRLDKSNLEDKYERNFMRLNVIPLLKKINPALEETFIRNTANFRQEAGIVNDYIEERSIDLITQTPGMIFINKKNLKHETYLQSVLHNLISGYGFNETQERNILKNIREDALPGKIFSTHSHQLSIDRNDLIIRPIAREISGETTISSLADFKSKKQFSAKESRKFSVPKKNELLVNKSRLVFPLTIREKKTGDKFMPFGMKNFKLLSDFFKDQKMNHFEKESCRLLVNGNNEIIWVIGRRSDERYKVDTNDTNLLKLTAIG